MSKYLVPTVAGAILLAFSAGSASALYACNGNVCWTVKEKLAYPAESKVIVREETWKPSYPAESKVIVREETWKPSADITIREPGAGRGYYVGTEWRTW
jgi:hypothetical protein